MAENKTGTTAPPVLKISAFVDATTAVLTGYRTAEIKEKDELYVLGIGITVVPGVNVPLVAPKASLEVTFAAGPYVLAQSPGETVQVTSEIAASIAALTAADLLRPRTEFRRRALSSDEKQFIGNPGHVSVSVGDPVIRKADLKQYIAWMAEHPGNTFPTP